MNLTPYALLLSLIAPMLLIPIEAIIPLPHIIEEGVKLFAIYMIIQPDKSIHTHHVSLVILAGLLFTFSESILYLVNIFMLGDMSLFATRLLLTGALHVGTMLILYKSMQGRFIWLISGYILAVGIHYWYNATIARLLMGS